MDFDIQLLKSINMPPRKQKAPEPTVQETPVIFFLKVPDDYKEHIIPAGESTSYADILSSVENTNTSPRFTTDLLKSIFNKIQRDAQYSPHTSCFWCCHGFEWDAFVLPISYDAYQHVYSCEGYFCSPECALAYLYADNRLTDSTRWNRHAMLNFLYSDLYTNSQLSPAPPRTTLRMFGGPLDIEQYRAYVSGANELVMSELPPIRVLFPSMNVQGPLRDVKKYVSLSSDVVEKASESLRLKRSKPVHVNVPTLDRLMSN